jgi:hypothetical protein
MERTTAILLALGGVIVALLILGQLDTDAEITTTAQPASQVIINDPDSVVVSDRTTVSDADPPQVQTIAPVQPPITQSYPRACAGTCTTACPMSAITSGYCPAGYVCCV